MLGKLRCTYGDLLLSVGEGGLAASGALGDIDVGILPSGQFCVGGEFRLVFSLSVFKTGRIRACAGVVGSTRQHPLS